MEQVRNRRLDNICEAIGEERATVNRARTEEQSLIQAALRAMQDTGVQVYKHSGVELARVPGAEKLRVRLVKDGGDAEVGEGETSSSQDGLEGAGDAAGDGEASEGGEE